MRQGRMKKFCLRDYLREDLKRITLHDPSIRDYLRWYFFPQGNTFPYIVWFRIVQKLKRDSAKIFVVLPYLILRHYEFKYGIHANTNIDVGEGLLIYHGDGVYLNCRSIGRNLTVYQSVTFGSDANKKIPIVKDNVTVYTGAVLCGDIIIDNDSTVGANAFVNKDVAAGTKVAGVPAHIIG